jgi:hypothetical protein
MSNSLYAKLKGFAEKLKINTKNEFCFQSPYKLNVKLQELKEYLEKFGINVERKRYARKAKIHKASYS